MLWIFAKTFIEKMKTKQEQQEKGSSFQNTCKQNLLEQPIKALNTSMVQIRLGAI